MTKTVYKLSNINGRFDHAYGLKAAVARANEIERETGLSKDTLTKEYGWTFKRLTAAQAAAVGMVHRKGETK